MIKLITVKAFSAAIEIDDSGKIISTPKILQQSIGWTVEQLMIGLRKNKFQSFTIEDVYEI